MEDLCRGHSAQRIAKVDTGEAAACWKEEVEHNGGVVPAWAMVLRTAGCSWSASSGGCTMCGYSSQSSTEPPAPEDLEAQFTRAMERLGAGGPPAKVLKIYTSGSFFDDREVPPEVRAAILKGAVDAGALKVIVETRPEYLTDDALEQGLTAMGAKGAGEAGPALEVAFGLETAADDVRGRSVHKGFSFADFRAAARICRGAGAPVRVYLLLKPPLMGEAAAMADVRSSIRRVAGLADTVSINPVNVQRHTLVESMWKRGLYRPPWLWSLVELLESHPWDLAGAPRVVSTPSGGGAARGAHNCGRCDGDVLRAVSAFSLTGDPSAFKGLDCRCKELWRLQLEGEEDLFQPGGVEVSHQLWRRL